MIVRIGMNFLLPLLALLSSSAAWTTSPKSRPTSLTRRQDVTRSATIGCNSLRSNRQDEDERILDRRSALQKATLFVTSLALLPPTPAANALVKGNAPPPKKEKPADGLEKCTNIDECQAMAEKRDQLARELEARGPPAQTLPSGTRYKDMEEGDGVEVDEGDKVDIYFKVLKLGKRSYDGLSGEGTVVFSRGYGLEDDEKSPKDRVFTTTVGSPKNIAALNEALVGINVGTIRRFSILPQKGWEKNIPECDGGPGGRGSGGDLKTDYVVVPTATMVDQEACFDQNKLPFPATYAQQRRMAQRFDQSLIMEVEVAKRR